MKLKELVSKQCENSLVTMYTDGQLSLSMDMKDLKEIIAKENQKLGEYTVLKFNPTVFHNISGNVYPRMVIYTKSKR